MSEKYKKSNTYLSKSLFIRGLQCHKSLYLHKYHPELKDEISDGQETLFQGGIDVGTYAQSLFPGGVEIPYDNFTIADQLDRTEKEIASGTKVLYEAAFSYNNIFVKVDILRKSKKGWETYEVKRSTEVKYHHFDDAAIQYYVLKGSGLPVSKAFLVHINKTYVRQGEIEVDKLFTIEDLTGDIIEQQELVKDEILKRTK